MVIVTLFSCEKEKFNYDMKMANAESIDTLIFAPSHYVLNADGISQVNFKLDVVPKDNEYGIIPLSRFNREDYQYLYIDENGKEIESKNDYLIFDHVTTKKTIKMFARMLGQETPKFDVEIRPVETKNIKQKSLTLIFHVFEYTGIKNTDSRIYPYHIYAKLNKLNDAFSHKISISGASVDTKVDFNLATETDKGMILSDVGINFLKLDGEYLEKSSMYSKYTDADEFNWMAYMKDNRAFYDPEKYLNIWIIPVEKLTIPKYNPLVIREGVEPLKGLAMKNVSADYELKIEDIGIVMKYNDFISQDLNNIMGTYLGLLPTVENNSLVDGDTDYCYDTFVYDSKQTNERKLDLFKKFFFMSDNIMDVKTTGIAVSMEQTKRIHYVLDNCPGRGMWKK